MDVVNGLLNSIWQVLGYTWWFWALFIFFPLFESTWIFWRQEDFKHHMPWVLLEIRIPRQIEKSYRAMEIVLGSIYAMRNTPTDYEEEWLQGEITRWYALEMVSFAGEVHFYVRVYRGQRELMEAAFFAAYPDVELVEVDDYAKDLPASIKELHERNLEIWGSEMVLAKEAAYPLQTHEEFEDFDEKKQFDPMSSFIEILAKAKKGEFAGVQYLIAPADPHWKDEFEEVIEHLRSKHSRGAAGGHSASLGVEFPHILPTFPVKSAAEKAEESGVVRSYLRTPGETDVLAAIDANLSQSAFETMIRFIFIAPKETFSDTYPRRGLRFMFNQYGALDLNYFVENEKMNTRVKIFDFPYILPKLRLRFRQHRILINYRSRQIPEEKWMGKILTSHLMNWNFHTKWNLLSKSSVASLFHPPTYMVLTGPHMKRVESRKAGPPAGLAIYGEEEQMERYQ